MRESLHLHDSGSSWSVCGRALPPLLEEKPIKWFWSMIRTEPFGIIEKSYLCFDSYWVKLIGIEHSCKLYCWVFWKVLLLTMKDHQIVIVGLLEIWFTVKAWLWLVKRTNFCVMNVFRIFWFQAKVLEYIWNIYFFVDQGTHNQNIEQLNMV